MALFKLNVKRKLLQSTSKIEASERNIEIGGREITEAVSWPKG